MLLIMITWIKLVIIAIQYVSILLSLLFATEPIHCNRSLQGVLKLTSEGGVSLCGPYGMHHICVYIYIYIYICAYIYIYITCIHV